MKPLSKDEIIADLRTLLKLTQKEDGIPQLNIILKMVAYDLGYEVVNLLDKTAILTLDENSSSLLPEDCAIIKGIWDGERMIKPLTRADFNLNQDTGGLGVACTVQENRGRWDIQFSGLGEGSQVKLTYAIDTDNITIFPRDCYNTILLQAMKYYYASEDDSGQSIVYSRFKSLAEDAFRGFREVQSLKFNQENRFKSQFELDWERYCASYYPPDKDTGW